MRLRVSDHLPPLSLRFDLVRGLVIVSSIFFIALTSYSDTVLLVVCPPIPGLITQITSTPDNHLLSVTQV